MLRALLLLCLLALQAGCTSLSSPDPSRLERAQKAVIFVPGFKGSVLSRPDGSVAWLTGWQTLMDGDALAVANAGALGLSGGPELKATGVMRNVGLLFGLVGYDVYGTWLGYLQSQLPPEYAVVEVAYDWRLGVLEGVRALSSTVGELRARGIQDISIVGHSMGGLVSAYYLRFGDQSPAMPTESWAGAKLIRSAALVATPFRGSIAMLRDMEQGASTLWNDTLLASEVLVAFPGSYDLLPSAEEDELLTDDGGSLVGALQKSESWSKHRWGLLSKRLPNAETKRDLRETALKQLLSNSDQLHAALLSPPWLADTNQLDLRLLVITGKGRSTLATALLNEQTGELTFKDDPRLFRDGDGLVSATSLRLPAGFNSIKSISEIQVDSDHAGAIQERRVQDAIVKFILQK